MMAMTKTSSMNTGIKPFTISVMLLMSLVVWATAVMPTVAGAIARANIPTTARVKIIATAISFFANILVIILLPDVWGGH